MTDGGSLWTGPGRYLLVGGISFVLLLGRSLSDKWIGDFWIYVAAIRELMQSPFQPSNPLFASDAPFAFFTPYLVAVALYARAFGLSPFTALVVQGLVNLVALLGALYAFVSVWAGRRTVAFYALVFLLFLWGPEPWLFSGFFHLRSMAHVLPYPSTFAAAVALGVLAGFPRLSRGGSYRWVAVVLPAITLLLIVHPVNALFLALGLLAASLEPMRPVRHFVTLGIVFAVGFALALLWPLVPLRELWFGQIDLVHQGNDTVYHDALRCFAPALLGLPWLAYRLRRNWRDPLAVLTAGLLLLYAYGGISGKWSYGRLIAHAILLLHVALADAAVELEGALRRLRGGRLHGALWPATLTGVLLAVAWPTAIRPTLAEVRSGDPAWLAFLDPRVGRYDVVLTDLETCWHVPSFAGRVVAYPMRLPFVPDHAERTRDVERFFAEGTDPGTRRAIVVRYGVRFVLLDKVHTPHWNTMAHELEPLSTVAFSGGDYVLLRIDWTRLGPGRGPATFGPAGSADRPEV